MKAAVFVKADKVEIRDLEKPVLQDHGAIIKIHGCGLCGSDIVKMKQGIVSEGAVLGHEIVGEVVEIRSENPNFKAGDKVVVGHHVPCYECTYCKNESYSMCRDFKESNIVPGGFAEYIYVSAAHIDSTMFKVPDDISNIEVSFVEPAACCLRAVRRSSVGVGSNVFVIGLGSIGQLLGQISSYYGGNVSGCDLIQERIDLARETGFSNVFKYSSLEETSMTYKATTNNIGADVVFLASGSLSSLPLALACVRDGGTLVVFASVSSSSGAFSNNDIYYRELTIMGSYSPAPSDLCESLNLIKNGKIKVDKFAKTYDLDNINEAINDSLSNRIMKAYIKISK